MSLRAVQALVLVAEHGTFRAVGDIMWMDPSSISKLITRLEADLRVRLVVRSTRQIRLTDAGKAAIPYAHALLSTAAAFIEVASNGQAPDELSVRSGAA